MNQNLQDFNRQKDEVELSLARTVLTQIEKENLSYSESQEIAKEILSQIDDIKETRQLLIFLRTLSQRWKIFENLFELYKLKMNEIKVKNEKLEEAKEQLSTIINN